MYVYAQISIYYSSGSNKRSLDKIAEGYLRDCAVLEVQGGDNPIVRVDIERDPKHEQARLQATFP